MRALSALLLCLVILLQTARVNSETVYLDGSKIQLDDNGHWHCLGTDRYIVMDDGRRIHLHDNGRWTIVDPRESMPESTQVHALRLNQPVITLKRGVIEKRKKKALKNTRVKTRMVLTLHLAMPVHADYTVDLSAIDRKKLSVSDSADKRYPVLGIDADSKHVEASEQTDIQVWLDGSPGWLDDADELIVTLKAGLFHLRQDQTIRFDINKLKEMKVDQFSTQH